MEGLIAASKVNSNLLLVQLALTSCVLVQVASLTPLTLTILHTSDVHSRFLETNKYGGACSDEEKAKMDCYGGFSRLHSKATEIRNKTENVIYLSGGDYFQGTVWYTFKKWPLLARFVERFNHTAMAIGNHEFDDEVAGLAPFIDNVTFPLVACNIDFSNEPRLAGKVNKSIVVNVGGWKVGIIGYTIREASSLSKPGKNLTFFDEVVSVTAEAKRLSEVVGVKIIVAVGHAGFIMDQKIAQIPYVDVVVGGHSNTFLYTGPKPSNDKPEGPYPWFPPDKSGAPVLEPYAFGKYMGYFEAKFDMDGKLVSYLGNPILLDKSVAKDPVMEAELQALAVDILEKTKVVIGKTKIFLYGLDNCKLHECNLGSLITDAMVESKQLLLPDSYWNDTRIGIMNGGGVRDSIPEGNITLEQLLTVLPFQTTIDFMEVLGKDLRSMLEHSIAGYNVSDRKGKFMQVSGIRVQYDLTQPNWSRVRVATVLTMLPCGEVLYAPLNDTAKYKVAVPTYMVNGGDEYSMIKPAIINYLSTGTLDSDIVTAYLAKYNPVESISTDRVRLIGLPPSETPESVTLGDYAKLRESYIQAEDKLMLGSGIVLNTAEQKANEILMIFKNREFQEGLESNGEFFPAAQHFFLAKDSIKDSSVFNIIKLLPKGAALHMHDFTAGSSDYVALELSKLENLYYCFGQDEHLLFKFYFKQPDIACNSIGTKWKLVQDYRTSASSPEFVSNLFMKSMSMVTPTPYVDYPDTDQAWESFERKISTIAGIVNYEPAFRKFYYKTLLEFYEDNVMYIEMRGLFNEVYNLNGTLLTPLEVVELYKQETTRFIADYPSFWGARVLYSPHRFQTPIEMAKRLNEALEMKTNFPEFFAGFDMVGQEDKGGPLQSFVPELLNASAQGLKFFFHAGETTWRGTPIDENLYDAILLNTTRIAHGYALPSHPYLMEITAEKGIAVELCPISNQVLGLVKDIRNHPGKALFKKNFPVVISSDGPGIWGSRGLSHDFYYAFMAMAGARADLRFIKQLAINSITYSAMSAVEKDAAITKFTARWTTAIDSIVQLYDKPS